MGLKYKNGTARSMKEHNDARKHVDRICPICSNVVGTYSNGAARMRSHLGMPANTSCVEALKASKDPKHKKDKKCLPS